MSGLRFRALAVRRMPGIHDGGFELADLAAGLNIVFGPNASGKTTTSRALEAAIWPPTVAPEAAWIEATFELDGDLWSVELDARRARLQRAGNPAGSPNVLPAEARDRYRLPLHELLTFEDGGLARAIALESVGGYDLEEAAQILSPRSTLSRPKREQEELRAARERLRAARALQDRLQSEVEGLRDDEARLARQPALDERLAFLRHVAEHAGRSEEVRAAAERLDAYPAVLARLAGDEDRRLRDLAKRLADASDAARTAAEEARQARRDLTRSRLSPEIAGSGEIEALERELVEGETIDAEVRQQDREVAGAQAKIDAEVKRLGGFAHLDLAAAVGPADIARLRPLLEDLQQIRARRSAAESELGLLDDDGDAPDRQRLEHGARALQRWLQCPAVDEAVTRRIRALALAGAVTLVLAGLLLTVVATPAILVAIVGLALLALVLVTRAPADRRPHHEGEFAELGLAEQPTAWQPDAVRTCLDRLHERLATARAAEHAAARRDRLRGTLHDVAAREAVLVAEVDRVAASLGLDRPGDVGLLLLLDRLAKLHDARAELDRAAAARVKSWAHRSELLARANQRLAVVGEEPVADLVGLRTLVRSLGERLGTYAKAEADLRSAEREQQSQQGRAEEARDEIAYLFARLEIEGADEATLAHWCADREPMLEARRAHDAIALERGRIEAMLRASPLYEDSCLEPDLAALDAEIRELEDERAGLDAVRERAARTRAEVDRATRGHEVEDALAEVERCIDNLREIRDRDARAALAETLVAHVESESRNEHRPEVFHRANRLFVSITRGRYELRLEDTGEAAFRAYDTQRARSQPLDELSSATRIQLLLAVRIAFVEVQEGRVRLPLLMDETLANSDADRAAAIMDAVLTLAADGRQVFYFTAQPDEVRKWQAALANHPAVSSKIFDLGEVRRLQKRLDLSDLESATQPAAGFPAPEGPSHAAYGALLHVPSVDVLAPAGALHLWYLFESPEPLHRAIATLGTDTWGGFKVLVENGATGVLPPDLVRKVEWLGIAAEAALRGMCTGRGRSLDRHALLASGAVSDTFIDEVVERCRSFDGDAARLLEALEARAVPKFLQKKIDALREFCLAEGYLDPREPLQPEKIRVEVIREVTPAIERREIGLVEVDRLLRRLGIRLPDFHANQRPELDLWKDPADGPRHRGDRSGFPRENSG